jgi:hypothetical protein
MKLSDKIASEINENGASVVVYPDQNGLYGVILYSLKGGQPHEQLVNITPRYLNEESAKKAGECLIKHIDLTSNLRNNIKCLSLENISAQ